MDSPFVLIADLDSDLLNKKSLPKSKAKSEVYSLYV